MSRNIVQEPEATECAGCQLVPLSHLSLDLPEPISGWERTLLARGIEVLRDDLGRACVARPAARQLMTERMEGERTKAEQAAARAAAREAPVPAGIPAVDDASPYESLVAAGGVVTPAQEFGGGRTPVFQELLGATPAS